MDDQMWRVAIFETIGGVVRTLVWAFWCVMALLFVVRSGTAPLVREIRLLREAITGNAAEGGCVKPGTGEDEGGPVNWVPFDEEKYAEKSNG